MARAAARDDADLRGGWGGVDDFVLDVAAYRGVGVRDALERAEDEVRRVVDEVFCCARGSVHAPVRFTVQWSVT